MSRYSRNEAYINILENEVMSLNKMVDDLVVEIYELKRELENLKTKTIVVPDLDYHNREYWEGRN
jgi:predicted RNase H-like nuclease (RuvC/YqgF family)